MTHDVEIAAVAWLDTSWASAKLHEEYNFGLGLGRKSPEIA